MIFNEETLEQAVIELFAGEQIPHCKGETIHKEMSDVLLRADLKQFLLNQYSDQDITLQEIDTIIRQLELYPSSAIYESNKSIMKLVADGFTLKREDRNKKDLFIHLIDFAPIENQQNEPICFEMNKAAEPKETYSGKDNNIYKFVNQLEILGYEKRIPDGIVYINGFPLVVFEFKSTVKENTTIKDAFTQLTVCYCRDIPELFKYNVFCVISDGVNNKMFLYIKLNEMADIILSKLATTGN